MFRNFICRQRKPVKAVEAPKLTGIAAIMEEARHRPIQDPCPVPGACVMPDGRFVYLPVKK